MHKVALSPHLISVWIKTDYWITGPAQAERQPEKRAMKLGEECVFDKC